MTLLKSRAILTKTIDWCHFSNQFNVFRFRKIFVFLAKRLTFVMIFTTMTSIFEYVFHQKTSMINLKSYKRKIFFITFDAIDDITNDVSLKKNRYFLKIVVDWILWTMCWKKMIMKKNKIKKRWEKSEKRMKNYNRIFDKCKRHLFVTVSL